jgi:hypothetical protein
MKYEVAMFQYVSSTTPFLTTWHREAGKDRNPDGYVRISEWVEVEFPALPNDAVAEAKRREVAATRERLQAELAALGEA